uniref:uncharacterized protein n=1 Tax=Semicossyphus pulcher TaxID=241346 RepID=UPI0037E8B051
MAAVGAEVTGSFFLSSGVVSFFILLLLLSIFLTALCSDCGRRSFELREPEDKNPSALIRVVKLEEAMVARENPMINEIRNDEKEFKPAEVITTSSAYLWNSHQGAPQPHQGVFSDVQTNGSAAVMTAASDSEIAGDSNPEEEISVSFTPWRNHLRAPQSHDLHTSAPPDSAHMWSSSGRNVDVSSPPANQEPGEDLSSAFPEDLCDSDVNSMYAQISRQVRLTAPTEHTPEEVQVEEESSPPLPDRKAQLEG